MKKEEKKDKKKKEKQDPYDEVVDELLKYEEGTPPKDPKYEYGDMNGD